MKNEINKIIRITIVDELGKRIVFQTLHPIQTETGEDDFVESLTIKSKNWVVENFSEELFDHMMP